MLQLITLNGHVGSKLIVEVKLVFLGELSMIYIADVDTAQRYAIKISILPKLFRFENYLEDGAK